MHLPGTCLIQTPDGPYTLCPGEEERRSVPQGGGPEQGVLVSLVDSGGLSCPDLCSRYLLPENLSASFLHYDSSGQPNTSQNTHKVSGSVIVKEESLVSEKASRW